MEVCYENIKATVNLLQELGLKIHPKKSVLFLTQKHTFWGFVLDSAIMTIRLTEERKNTIYPHCEMLLTENISIGELAQIINIIVSAFRVVTHG